MFIYTGTASEQRQETNQNNEEVAGDDEDSD